MAASHGWQLLAMKRRQVLFTVFILSTEEEDLKHCGKGENMAIMKLNKKVW